MLHDVRQHKRERERDQQSSTVPIEYHQSMSDQEAEQSKKASVDRRVDATVYTGAEKCCGRYRRISSKIITSECLGHVRVNGDWNHLATVWAGRYRI